MTNSKLWRVREEIVAMAKHGCSTSAIATYVGCTRQGVRQFCLKEGIEFTKRLIPISTRPEQEVELFGAVAFIHLTRGRIALIDASDIGLVRAEKWIAIRSKSGIYYAKTSSGILLHRHLLGLKEGDPDVDHKDGNGLNNRRSNIRTGTTAQNNANRFIPSETGFRGVVRRPNGRYGAFLTSGGLRRDLGTFVTAEKASAAREKAEEELHGEFAFHRSRPKIDESDKRFMWLIV